ncbi:Histone-lysine N-methyltransferase SETMAR, partial [Ooceraea biroi]
DISPESLLCKWFARFRSGDVNVSDAARSGRPSTTDDDQIVAAIKADRHLTTREIAERFDIAHTTVAQRLKRLGMKGVVFHHDNAKPHTALVTKKKLKCFGWEVMQHPPYSPDLAPSDYRLFRSLQNNLDGHRFNSVDDIQTYLKDFFAQKSRDFYKRGIMSLPERWQKVVDQDGQYILD